VKGTVAAAVAAIALLAPSAHADEENLPPAEHYRLRLQYREHRPTLSGEMQKANDDRDGTVVDVVDDLGVSDHRSFRPEFRGGIAFKRGVKFRGHWIPIDFDGDRAAGSTFTYGATRFARQERVVTSVKGHYAGADFEYDFWEGRRGFLGAVVGAKLFDTDAAVVSPGQAAQEIDTIRAAIPVLGLTGRIYQGRMSFEAEFVGIDGGANVGKMFDAEGAVRLHLSDRLGAMVGYRYLMVEAHDGRDRVKINLSGLQFGLEISL
jgi:hypothetical protein